VIGVDGAIFNARKPAAFAMVAVQKRGQDVQAPADQWKPIYDQFANQ